MEKINSFKEVIYYLKEGQLLSSDKKDVFVYRKEKVCRYFSGSCVKMDLDDFTDLYGEESFYLYRDSSAGIDEDKDEAYYRYYRK